MFNPEAPPELSVTRWLTTGSPPTLESLRGKVVVVLAFQMLCEGCVKHALPQAARLAVSFSDAEVAVLGLHSVFENHKAQAPPALQVFVEEHGWPFPVAIDQPNGQGLPETMSAYEMQGTPTLLLFDRQGRLRRHYLGHVDDVRLAAEVMALALEDAKAPREVSIAIERRLAAVLVDPDAHHHHDGCCGHDHDHDHHHGHEHVHGEGCCGGHAHEEMPSRETAGTKPKSA
jgi:peroxiredoxin